MNNYTGVEIAIIGMAGQFPGADNVDEFWNNLKNGVESISFFTDEELREEGVPDNILRDPSYVKANAFLRNKEYFDAAFFGYRPGEARLMDPQLRIFHETCWKAIEDAGYDIRNCTEKVGLFAGGSTHINWMTYSILSNRDNAEDGFTVSLLRDVTFLCSRISYVLSLKGPSVFINTACSTSLVAIQRACMSLLLRECQMALAGGVTVKSHSKKGFLYADGMVNSRDGHCRAFDADASGSVGGEGAGVVVLKRLEDALADRDHIHAVIRGSGINNDGDQKISFTAPSIDGQSQVILKALQMSGVAPETVGYIETHGTATPLGDPIEVEALNIVFGRSSKKYCALGSVKTNIGHLDSAAGVAGLIKTVLALKHRQIPPSLNFTSPNSKINFTNTPFFVNTTLGEWKNGKHPRRAGVSSFGIGGTNAHVILEEAPALTSSSQSRDHQLLVFSALTAAALDRNIENFRQHLEQNEHLKLADVAYTLQVGRSRFPYRKALVCNSREEAIALCAEKSSVRKIKPLDEKIKYTKVFMFSGQGSQYMNMCRDLYDREDLFREACDRCFSIVKHISGKDIKPVVFISGEQNGSHRINRTEFTQPSLFIIEYALARLAMSWGIMPDVMIGHSFGEYVAACISGVFSLEDALALVVKRGKLMQKASSGKMMGISADYHRIMELLDGRHDIAMATVNSTELCVISGSDEAIEEFKTIVEKEGHVCKNIPDSHAYHSPLMNGILDKFEKAVSAVKMNPPGLPFISNLTGQLAIATQVTQPKYWVEHLRHTVRFSDGIETLFGQKNVIFLEVGPGVELSVFVRSNKLRKNGHKVVNLVRHENTKGDDLRHLLGAVGKLWSLGVEPQWENFYASEKRSRVPLPAYSFEKIRYPVNVDALRIISELSSFDLPGNERDVPEWFYTPTWKRTPLVSADEKQDDKTRNLIFADNNGAGALLVRKFRRHSEHVIWVRIGDRFSKESGTDYTISPGSEEDYHKLFGSLSESGLLPDRIIHCWALSAQVTNDYGSTLAVRSADICFYSLYHVIRAAGRNGGILGKQITVVTNDLHGVVVSDNIVPVKALSLGLLKVITQEYPTVITSHIDISLAEKIDDNLLDALVIEIRQKDTGKVVSFRSGWRWVQVFDRIRMGNDHGENFKENGVYFITGGLGEIGFNLSKYLLRAYRAKLILLGRTRLSRNGNNTQGATTGREDVEEKRSRLRELQEQGDVIYFDCDISDKATVTAIVKEAEAKLGPIQGVVHAAGIIRGASISPVSELSKADFEYQFASKVTGLHVVKEVMQHKKLDFCLVLSSLSAVLGGLGFGAYASANIFMDYYLNTAREKGELENWISVDFEDFNFKDHTRLAQVFNGILSLKRLPLVVMSKTDLNRRLDQWVNRKVVEEEREMELSVHENVDGSSSTVKKLIAMWESFFGRSPVSEEDDFFDIGGDSLKALTMIARIHKLFSVELSIREFFNHPIVKQLGDRIDAIKKGEGRVETYSRIPKAGLKEFYALSPAQQRLYFLYELDKTSLAYNVTNVVRLEGVVDIERLSHAFSKLFARHESLRTSFVIINDELVLKIAEHAAPDIAYFSCGEAEAPAVIRQFVSPFDLSVAPLMRVALVGIADNDHLLILDMHHTITDGVSLHLLIKDFIAFYNGEDLPPLDLQYKDYTTWQKSDAQQSEIEKQKAFWINEFSEMPPPFQLPEDFQRPPVKNYEGDFVTFVLSQEETGKLKSMADSEGVTMFMLVLAFYNILLSKLSGSDDIVVGTTTAGRHHADLEQIVGMFVHTLPLRNRPGSEISFNAFLARLKEKTLACFNNQDYPYEDLIAEVKVERDTSRNPLFDVMFSYLNFSDLEASIPGLSLRPYDNQQKVSMFDLTLWAIDKNDQLQFRFEYSTALFRKGTIERFAAGFKRIMHLVTGQKDILLSDIEIVIPEEKHRILETFNNTNGPYAKDKTVVHLFEKQVLRTPRKVAVVYEDITLTYQELNELSNRLAHYLRDQYQVKPNDLIAFMGGRSERMLIGLLAILKSGAAYVPVDPSYPEDRINYMLHDCGAKILLTDNALPPSVQYDGSVVQINAVAGNKVENPLNTNTSDDLCYLIYTSGSTGKPKGVMISHYNVMNFFAGMNDRFRPGKDDCLLAVTSTSFDISVLELFWTVCHGVEVVIHPSDISIAGLDRYLSNGEVSMDFSLFFFSSYDNKVEDKYNLLLESVRYADAAGFKAVWTPERHFHEFGGLYPNPSVISSALSMITEQIELRSGSIVSPLHDSIRIAEEWSVVDNLSNGRVGLSFASGWNPNDFALSKGSYNDRQRMMYEQIDVIKKLWRSEKIKRENGYGQEAEVQIFPEPVQADLPIWITSSGSEDTFKSAGAIGANLLTHLLGQDLEELARKIALYRDARTQYGHKAETGKVTIMLHTYIGDDVSEVEKLVEPPFIEYLKSSIGLSKVLMNEAGLKEDDLSAETKQMILKNAFRRYYETGSLIGTRNSCLKMLHKLREIGVDEVACLIDFGIEETKVLEGLRNLVALKEAFLKKGNKLHKPVTIMQSTPSFIKVMRQDPGSEKFLQSLQTLLLGGEPVKSALVRDLQSNSHTDIYNMYGPTETTIWSGMHKFGTNEERVSIGKPILNTQMYILDKGYHLVPVGVAGDLYIGGEGLARGYRNRPELTEERFIANPFVAGKKIYKTGDVARWLPDGSIELMGRKDDQVKLRGFRIEPGEIENVLAGHECIQEAVVLAREKGDNKFLVAYYTADSRVDSVKLRKYLGSKLPDYMIPSFYVQMPGMPLTPNGKINRKAFPDPEISAGDHYIAPSTALQERLIAIWSEVLQVDKGNISTKTNFFELGGHSISIIALTRMINREFGCNISIANMFMLPTILSIEDFILSGDHEIKTMAENIDMALDEANANLNLLEDLN